MNTSLDNYFFNKYFKFVLTKEIFIYIDTVMY